MNLRDRPYLDVEVVEVKVKEYIPKVCRGCEFLKKGCKDVGDRRKEEFKRKPGNWVNGENLDKMEFPCYCTFDANKGMFGEPGETYKVWGIGKIDLNYTEGQRKYQLSWADHQQHDLSVLCETPSLKRLMEIYDIHIEKAKIVIFKEVKE